MMNKFAILIFAAATLVFAPCALATPAEEGNTPPIGSFTRVEPGLIPGITGPAWCYDDNANTTLILMGEREKLRCDFKLIYEIEKEKIKSKLIIDNLNLRIEMLTKEHGELDLIKNKEIARLTEIASKTPNEYSVWWASGGFVVGIITAVAITYVVTQ